MLNPSQEWFVENGANVIRGIVHLLGQVAVIYALIDAVTMILNLNIVLMSHVIKKWTVLISMMITMEYLMFSSLNMKDLRKVPGNPVKINDLLYAHASNLILNAVRISIFRKDRSKFHMSHIK